MESEEYFRRIKNIVQIELMVKRLKSKADKAEKIFERATNRLLDDLHKENFNK